MPPIAERVATKALGRLGVEFVDSDQLVREMSKKLVSGTEPHAIADEFVDRMLPPRISRDEARGQLETLVWLVKDELTGGA